MALASIEAATESLRPTLAAVTAPATVAPGGAACSAIICSAHRHASPLLLVGGGCVRTAGKERFSATATARFEECARLARTTPRPPLACAIKRRYSGLKQTLFHPWPNIQRGTSNT